MDWRMGKWEGFKVCHCVLQNALLYIMDIQLYHLIKLKDKIMFI